jgi:hypothetical protein
VNARMLQKLPDSDLIAEFRTAAIQLGEAIQFWMPAAKLSKKLLNIQNEIHSRGHAFRMTLAPFLKDENRFVQYYAACHLLALVPERSREIVEENSKQGDAIAGDAGMLLYTIESGIYKPD